MKKRGEQQFRLGEPDRYGNRTYSSPSQSFQIQHGGGNVWSAHKMDRQGNVAKAPGAALSVLGRFRDEPPQIHKVFVKPGYRGKGIATAMLGLAQEKHPDLSHSHALSPEGAAWARKTPLPGDTEATRQSQRRVLGE